MLIRDEIINFRIPLLEEGSGRDREIKQFGPRKVEEVIYQHLFFDKDHRSLDKEFLNKSDGSTKGRISANILYYFGIKGKDENNKAKFRGIFKDVSLQQGIDILKNHLELDYPPKRNLESIIQHLKNFSARIEGEDDVDYIEETDDRIRERLDSDTSQNIDTEDKVKAPRLATINKSRTSFSRDASIAVDAILLAKFKCEVDRFHSSFTSRKYGCQYVEAHHLVPMKNQEHFFDASLDVHANIVALCPNCHRLLHHGVEGEYSNILRRLLESRQTRLIKCGIEVDFEQLVSMY